MLRLRALYSLCSWVPNPRMHEEDKLWLFDSVVGFLKGPEWAVPVWNFIDDNCIVFDSEEENKLAYHEIFNAFREMAESLIEMHLSDVGCTMEEFAELCSTYATTEVGREVTEQILAVDDFVSFKNMMVKRNVELELETMKQLQLLSDQVQDGAVCFDERTSEEEGFEAQLQQALALSLKDMQESGLSTDVNAAEIRRQQEEAEEADLRMALALSLQLDKQQELMEEQGEAPPEIKAPRHRAAPPPSAARPPSDIDRRRAPMPALAPLMREPPARTEAQQLAADQAVEVARRAAASAAAVREREVQEREERVAAERPRQGGVSEAEMRARAEHLKKQRDLILANRKKAREAELGPPTEQITPPSNTASTASQPVTALRYLSARPKWWS